MRVPCVIALTMAALACWPLAADASTAFVDQAPDGARLVVTPGANDGANTISLSSTSDGLRFLVEDLGTAITAGAGCTPVDTAHVSCDAGGVRAVRVNLGAGDDALTIGDLVYPANPPPAEPPLWARGETGKDRLGGGAGPDTLNGGPGDDPLIAGRGGDDNLAGSDGSDVVDGGPGSEAALSGGPGDDTISGGSGDDRAITGGDGTDSIDTGEGNDVAEGDGGRDTVIGGPGDDRLEIGSGRESDAADGPDSIEGGPGDDIIGVGPTPDADGTRPVQGPDVLSGGEGTDTADFSERSTSLRIDLDGEADDGESGEHDNVLPDVENVIGGTDGDTLTGSGADNLLDGRDGDDRIGGGGGDDMLDGGANNPGSDALDGGGGRDTLNGRAGDDSLDAGDGDDVLSGAGGTDKLDGEGGNDSLAGGPGGDALNGGTGNDVVNGAEANLIGADGADDLAGGPGADVLLGDDGNDELDGGPGPDPMSGGAGRDTVDYENRSGPVTVTLDGVPNDGQKNENDNVGRDVEIVLGGTVDDSLFGDRDANRLDGGSGEDLVVGNAGPDILQGGDAPDVVQARDGSDDVVACGDEGDLAIVDQGDAVRGCETVDPGGKRRLVVGDSALVRASQRPFGLRLPNGHHFFSLSNAVKIPMASTVDPEDGKVRLATARNSAGARQEVSVSAGVFSVRQETGQRPVTELRLAGKLEGCRRSAAGRRAAADNSRRRLYTRVDKRKRGNFRVRGRYSSGAAVGTAWLTEDRCDGTLTRVDSGVVRLRDLERNRTITVRAGQTYLARAG